jgi:O-antigen/teichoic acid export membrane protein
VYQTTTAWLVLLSWPLYLLVINYGSAVLSIFGHSYRAGSGVMVILGCSMLVASGSGVVDVVLTSTGRSALSLANGLAALIVNVGLDLVLIPRYGITGAAIGWAAAITVANLVPLAQVARIIHVHPFGRGTIIAYALTAVSFGAIPALVGALVGRGAAASVVAVATGCAVLAAGLWRWRDQLQLSMIRRPLVRGRGFPSSLVPASQGHPEVA